MGKYLIIKNADFSNNAIEQVNIRKVVYYGDESLEYTKTHHNRNSPGNYTIACSSQPINVNGTITKLEIKTSSPFSGDGVFVVNIFNESKENVKIINLNYNNDDYDSDNEIAIWYLNQKVQTGYYITYYYVSNAGELPNGGIYYTNTDVKDVLFDDGNVNVYPS